VRWTIELNAGEEKTKEIFKLNGSNEFSNHPENGATSGNGHTCWGFFLYG